MYFKKIKQKLIKSKKIRAIRSPSLFEVADLMATHIMSMVFQVNA
jgi:hypothetical protein